MQTNEKKFFDLVMINMSSFSEWKNGVANRNRFVLKELMKRPEIRKVLIVDFMPFTLKRAVRNYYQNILHGVKGNIIHKGIFDRCVKYTSNKRDDVIPDGKSIYIYSTVESLWSEELVIQKIRKMLRILEFENILLWSYQPMFVGYFKKFGERISIFDAVDNWMENIHFAPYRNRLKKNYGIISEEADIIFTVAEDIVTFFKSYGRKDGVYWIPNGVDLEHFLHPLENDSLKKIFQTLQHPLIGYIGTIQNRIDFELIEHIAKNRSDWTIVLAGPTWPVYFKKFRRIPQTLKRLKRYKNIFFTGAVPYKNTPSVIHYFDVGIIPHTIDSFVKSMNPMKMYDYLACGKPIVSTPGAGVEMFENIISRAHSKDEFIKQIEEALRNDSPILREQRLRIIQNHTYEKRVHMMFKYIYEKC